MKRLVLIALLLFLAGCGEDFMMIRLTLNPYDKTSPFTLSLNELGFLGGNRTYNFASEDEF